MTSQKFRKRKMVTFRHSQCRGSILQLHRRSFKASYSLKRVIAAEANSIRSGFRNCPARSLRCNKSNAWGHFAKVCRKTAPVQSVSSDGAVDVVPEHQASTKVDLASSSSVSSSDHPAAYVLTVDAASRKYLVVHAVVDGVTLQLLVDTGASVSLMTVEDFQRHFSKQHILSKAVVDLRNFSK
ncbi:hypothetical protein MTO96_033452 [Rhipicephalus appendiculatus]